MPKGVYERGPGKKAKGPNNNSFLSKKTDKGSFSRKPSNGGAFQTAIRRGSLNQYKGIWIKQLADLGYGAVGRAPNRAVQSILCLIPNPEIHGSILRLNSSLPQDAYSPVVHLGFSAWLDLFLKLDGLGMVTHDCEKILQQVFSDIPNILADRTDLDDVLAIECKAGVAYLEKVNKVKDKDRTFNNDPMVNEEQTPGFTKFIPREDLEIMKMDGDCSPTTQSLDLSGDLVRLTLHNCLRFPIISEMAIEWLGEEFDHGLWRSQNFSTLAPISTQAWIMIAGLNNDHLAEVDEAAKNMTKLVDKEEMEFPFGTALFDKHCQNNNGITVFTKAHMAYPGIKREYNYLHRIWRSYSPYFKCNCTDNAVCKDSITWFDQAIWFACNHLDLVYQKYSPAGRMGAFLNFIQQKLKRPVMAHLVYLQVRAMMVKITNKLAADPECNVQATFGRSKLVDVCEMMVKDRNFVLAKHNMAKEENTTVQSYGSVSRHEDYMPPRVSRISASSSCQMVENITDGSDSIVNCTNDENSVCKGPKPGGSARTEAMKQNLLRYSN